MPETVSIAYNMPASAKLKNVILKSVRKCAERRQDSIEPNKNTNEMSLCWLLYIWMANPSSTKVMNTEDNSWRYNTEDKNCRCIFL